MKTGFIAGLVTSLMVNTAFADDAVEHERMIQKSVEFQKRFESASPERPNLSVNKSLGLNETRVLQTAKILSRLNTHLLYSKLLKLDTTANEELEKQFKVEAASYFKNHIKTIQFIEDEIGFKISEKIDFNQADLSSNSKPTIYLTEEHLNVIKQSQYSYLTSLLHDFRTKLKPKSNKFNTKRYGGNLRP